MRIECFLFVAFVLFVVIPLTIHRAKGSFAENSWPVLQAKDSPSFSVFGHGELVAFRRELNLRKVAAPFLDHE